jgi:hypothetical protein
MISIFISPRPSFPSSSHISSHLYILFRSFQYSFRLESCSFVSFLTFSISLSPFLSTFQFSPFSRLSSVQPLSRHLSVEPILPCRSHLCSPFLDTFLFSPFSRLSSVQPLYQSISVQPFFSAFICSAPFPVPFCSAFFLISHLYRPRFSALYSQIPPPPLPLCFTWSALSLEYCFPFFWTFLPPPGCLRPLMRFKATPSLDFNPLLLSFSSFLILSS